jgi:hypothetical protein
VSEDFVLKELRALKEAYSRWEAGPEVELQLLEALRRRRVARTWRRSAVVAVAAGVVGILAIRRSPAPAAVEISPPASVVVEAPPVPAAEPASANIRRPTKRTITAKIKVQPVTAREVATEFFPLMDTPPPFERGELLRVVVPAATMRTVGLPVGDNHLNDSVQADILIGQEGLARAIRFVNYQQ